MRVVVEPVEETLAHVLVDEGVVDDVVAPLLELCGIGQFAVDEQIGHLEVARLLGELLDRVTAVPEDSGLAVEFGDGALGGSGGAE